MMHRDALFGLAMFTVACCFMFLLALFTSEPMHDTGPNGRQYTTVVIDDCEYIQRAYDGHIFHKGNCRNPLHWEKVLQDTSWYKTLPKRRDGLDSKLEIHTPKGNRHEEEDRGL